ncbi:UDP-glycosyltransferase 90A1-like [Papaver somniferum]|uniref:UDP-glycosyltransferase 90A1-like n=1 Tax=Papaver somniferum TaxID=3469 RepID=UPI000E6F56AA|nr:UDP-glycosyltransferase 90A1-like [Papaver somniferum]
MALYKIIGEEEFPVSFDDEVFHVAPYFPGLKLAKNDFEPEFSHPGPGEHTNFYTEEFIATENSHGIIMNSFRELEPEFVDHWNREALPRAWCIGPLCLASEKKVVSERNSRPMCTQWLNEMSKMEKPVLYVAFGSVIEMTIEQYREIAIGLANSGETFLPMLGFPITADQHLNARMIEEYFRIGVKVVTRTGSVRGFFDSECIEKKVKELTNIEDEKWKEMSKNVKKLSERARDAMEVGGSSWHSLNLLIDEVVYGKENLKII